MSNLNDLLPLSQEVAALIRSAKQRADLLCVLGGQ